MFVSVSFLFGDFVFIFLEEKKEEVQKVQDLRKKKKKKKKKETVRRLRE